MYNYENYSSIDKMLSFRSHTNLRYHAHLHRCFEFIICTSGQILVEINGEQIILNEGSATLIFPNTVHRYETLQHSLTRAVLFDGIYISQFYRFINGRQPRKLSFKPSSILLEMLDESYSAKPKENYGIKALLYRLCSEFSYNNELVECEYNDDYVIATLLYIQKHFTDKITLSDVAKNTGYDYYYLSKCLQKAIGIPFNTIVSEYRIECSKQLLLNNELKMADIAFRSGFGSIRSFNRRFMDAVGVTPKEYKKMYEKSDIVSSMV